MKRLIGMFALLVLTACAGMDNQVTTSVEYGCASATAALKTAIVFNDKLTPALRAQITHGTNIINPICSQPTVPTLDTTARAAFDVALKELTGAADAVD